MARAATVRMRRNNKALIIIDLQKGVLETCPPPHQWEDVLNHVNALAEAARAGDCPVVFLTASPVDKVIRKTTCDAFFQTELEDFLRARGVEELVIAGYATDFCMDTTIRSAASKEFGVVVAREAHTTKDRTVLSAEQIKAHHEWVWENFICTKSVCVVSTTKIRQLLRQRP